MLLREREEGEIDLQLVTDVPEYGAKEKSNYKCSNEPNEILLRVPPIRPMLLQIASDALNFEALSIS